jgi:hypothetical protein
VKALGAWIATTTTIPKTAASIVRSILFPYRRCQFIRRLLSRSAAFAASGAAATISKRHNLDFIDASFSRFGKDRLGEGGYRQRIVTAFRRIERQVCLDDQYSLWSPVRKLYARHRQDALYVRSVA